jgi:hypothetical protein
MQAFYSLFCLILPFSFVRTSQQRKTLLLSLPHVCEHRVSFSKIASASVDAQKTTDELKRSSGKSGIVDFDNTVSCLWVIRYRLTVWFQCTSPCKVLGNVSDGVKLHTFRKKLSDYQFWRSLVSFDAESFVHIYFSNSSRCYTHIYSSPHQVLT